MKAWFSVVVEARAPEGTGRSAIGDVASNKLMDLLAEHDSVVASADGWWQAAIGVESDSAIQAAGQGVALIEAMAGRAGMPGWPVIRVEAAREEVFEEDNAAGALPDIVSVPEAAEILGVSPQRVHELAGGAGFPRPVYDLKVGRLWLRDAIETYGASRNRKPGRPGRGALMRQRVIGALIDSGITVADVRVFMAEDGDGDVVVQFARRGSHAMRRRIAATTVATLRAAGLGVVADVFLIPGDSAIELDIEEYLAEGHAASVSELPEITPG